MRFFLLFLFLLIVSCSSNKSAQFYICGDHPCVNKKEMKDYFDNNIAIEVYTVTSSKEEIEKLDLVQLNLLKDELIQGNKADKKKSLKENKKNIEKLIKERKKVSKLKLKQVEETIKKEKKIVKKNKISKPKKSFKNEKGKPLTLVRLCKNLDECDIENISKIIMDLGKEKPFPDIAAN